MTPETRELIDRLFSDVQRGELDRAALIEALEDAHDMGQITAAELAELMERLP